ncbi:putative gag protein [Cucumis melo var. makuwa]|uniref:Gag protein n=1 Tax=Cucumis melo var. makuwa TaxID=1194695 RepID=A0A5D3DSP4_CUCMM|nr:putative gag protein [Cucumis melo var. makuwa]TYK26528.1 putative gag protein [Cucumis melo var. makuwa]
MEIKVLKTMKLSFQNFMVPNPKDFFQWEHETEHILRGNDLYEEKNVTVSIIHFKGYAQTYWDKVCSKRRRQHEGPVET